jgi:glycosyltransferase involved in cell wall biosynthesis
MELISIIVPLYNEEENVSDLYSEIKSVADESNLNCEFVFVDDGSKDRTVENLVAAAENDQRVKVVSFRRNFGQTAAMAAGFDYAEGDIVITLDGDLQNDPRAIPAMVEKIHEGYDLVAGWRKDRQDAMVSRKIPSKIANWLISKITKVELHDYGCTLKAMRGHISKNIKMYGEMHRFIPALAAEQGVKIFEMPVNHRPRTRGVSKYGISRTFRVILDLLTVKFFLGYSTRPLHMFGALGMSTGGLGMLLIAWMAFQRAFFDMPMGNRPLLTISTMLVLIGLQFICFGLLAEVLVRTYHESQNKKIYTVRNAFRVGDNSSISEKVTALKVNS